MQLTAENYRDQLIALALTDDFVRLTMSGAARAADLRWQRVVVRPVQLKNGRAWQAAYFDQRQNITKNYALEQASAALGEIIDLPLSNITLETTSERIQVQRSKKGKVILSRARNQVAAPDLRHNHVKALPLPSDRPDAYLQKTGIMTNDGIIRASMSKKYTQINEFLRVFDELELKPSAEQPLRILDAGCGSAYLTFAAYHYLVNIKGLAAVVIGVDSNEYLIDKCRAQAAELGYTGMEFIATPLADWQPAYQPDVVFSLHACDTATDDALALALRSQAQAILSVPCCHKHLTHQIQATVLKPMLRHGSIRQRTADLVTDSLRAQILRINGYRSEIIEFVDAEHTGKNLMIRATRSNKPDPKAAAEYEALKQFWGVTPYLEQLLGSGN
ncbi:class I SAM-dependent methyltransferase [Herpetosiphon sp. NSE202]|uniref:class I SAM-dependent methyltransferase n=1 Tax=Herpetosiphon sp. NSE202 TaxID=3351349 RepID=UPI0036362DDD